MPEKTYDMVVLGGGPGGMTAAIYGARANLNVLILEKMAPGGQLINTDWIDNYPGFPDGISGVELATRLDKQSKRFGAEFTMGEVTEVRLTEEPKVITTTKETIYTKSVIIATGESPRKLGVPGEGKFTGRGVSYCATCDGAFFQDKEVAVIGGGDAAVEEAVYLARLAKKVHIIHRRDQLRAVDYVQQKAINNDNIEILYNTVVEQINGKQKGEALDIKNVATDKQDTLEVDGVFVYIGAIPNTGFLAGEISLDGGYVVTDEDMNTDAARVYAVGDIRKKSLKQVVTAMSDGAVAAFNAEKNLS